MCLRMRLSAAWSPGGSLSRPVVERERSKPSISGDSTAESPSTALMPMRADCGDLRRAIQNSPRDLRDPGVMSRKGLPGCVPRSSAPVRFLRSAPQAMKTALDRRSTPRMRWRKQAARIAGSTLRCRERNSSTAGQKVGSRSCWNGSPSGRRGNGIRIRICCVRIRETRASGGCRKPGG